jgi:hypothetical protein
MVKPGDYADALRAVGRFLDSVGASRIEIVQRADHWLVGWGQESATRVQVLTLEALRTTARLFRDLEGSASLFRNAQILRTLGQLLDAGRATNFAILEVGGGYQVTVTIEGEQSVRTYPLDEIRMLAEGRQALRHAE